MITGTVTERLDLLVTIEVSDSAGGLRPIEVVLDTGFDGDLALPSNVISDLELSYIGTVDVRLATGKKVKAPTYEGVVSWHGRQRNVIVIEAGDGLLGMALILGSKLTVDARIGGEVLIEETSP